MNFGGLPYELSEGDIITIFSQYGEPTFLKLARDRESGKSKGFGWLKYEDQRSTDLAVDNLGGAEIAGRLVRVDHARYKPRDDEDPDEFLVGWEDIARRERMAKRGAEDARSDSDEDEQEEEEEVRRPMLKEERELAKLIAEHDDDDPMKGFLIDEKKQEVERALRKEGERGRKERRHKHHRHRDRDHHHRSHRSRREKDGADDDEDNDSRHRRHKRTRRDETPVADEGGARGREDTPDGRRRDGSRDRERRRRGEDERDRDRDQPRDKERGGRREDRDRDGREERPRQREGDRRDTARDHHKRRRSRSRSRSRSPRSHRDR